MPVTPARAPSFKGLRSSSEGASRAKRSNGARNTAPERELRRSLRAQGARYRLHSSLLPGRPDIVFPGARIVVFCDGDFWHGRNWGARKRRLRLGANSEYWIAKIQSNICRDKLTSKALQANGWEVIRVWESDIRADSDSIAKAILRRVRAKAAAR